MQRRVSLSGNGEKRPMTLHERFSKLPPPLCIDPVTLRVISAPPGVLKPGAVLSSRPGTAPSIGAGRQPFSRLATHSLNSRSTTVRATSSTLSAVTKNLSSASRASGTTSTAVSSTRSASTRPSTANVIPRVAMLRPNPIQARSIANAASAIERSRTSRREATERTVREIRSGAADRRRHEQDVAQSAREQAAHLRPRAGGNPMLRTDVLSERSRSHNRAPPTGATTRPTSAMSSTSTKSLPSSASSNGSRSIGNLPASSDLRRTAPLPRVALLAASKAAAAAAALATQKQQQNEKFRSLSLRR